MSTPSRPDIWMRLFSAYDSWADAAAIALGVNRTDLACLRALFSNGPMTAGALAETSALTTGAITGILDRLERVGLIRREGDPQDRRRVLALIPAERAAALATLFAALGGEPPASADVAGRSVIERQTDQLLDEATRLRNSANESALTVGPDGWFAIALGSLSHGALEVVGGVMDVQVTGRSEMSELALARLGGSSIKLTERDGNIRLANRLRLHATRERVELQLNHLVPWAIRVSGGRNHVRLNLAALTVTAIDVVGGNGEFDLAFGANSAPTLVKVDGGANNFVIRHSPSTPVEVSVRGTLALRVNGKDLGRQLNSTWRTPGLSGVGVQVLVSGGFNTVSVLTHDHPGGGNPVPNA